MRELLHERILSIAAPRSLNRMQLLRNEKNSINDTRLAYTN